MLSKPADIIGTVAVDKFYRPLESPISKNKGAVPAIEFSARNQIQSRSALLSNVNIKNFIIVSETATASGTIGNGVTLFLSSDLTPDSPHQFEVNHGQPYVAIYQGTAAVSANQIYPVYGSNITPGSYTVQGALDYNAFGTASIQTLSTWRGNITDVSAGNQNIFLVTFWKWIQYNAAQNG